MTIEPTPTRFFASDAAWRAWSLRQWSAIELVIMFRALRRFADHETAMGRSTYANVSRRLADQIEQAYADRCGPEGRQ